MFLIKLIVLIVLRVLIGMVSGATNISTEYKNAGIHVTISDVLVGQPCDNTCTLEKLVAATEESKGWRGWMVRENNIRELHLI